MSCIVKKWLMIGCFCLALCQSFNLSAQVIGVPIAVGQELDSDAVKTQRIALLRSYVKTQLSYIQVAVILSDEQKEKAATLNEDWLRNECEQAEKKKAKPKNAGNILGQAFGARRQVVNDLADGQNDPIQKTVQTVIDKTLNDYLTTEQQETLKQEKLARDQFQAQALAELTVALIERQIYLSDEQAQKLVPSLTGKINKSCGWHVYLNNPQYIPTIPKAALSNVLSEDHMRFIRGLNQQDFIGNDFGFVQMLGGEAAAQEE